MLFARVINATKTYRYDNGTEQTVTGYVDVATGDNEEIGAFFFVTPNLNINDSVYPQGLYADKIIQTTQRTYANSQRQALVDSSTFNYQYTATADGKPATHVLDSQIDYYFDKETGMCLEQREQTTITDPATNQSETTTSRACIESSNAPSRINWKPTFPASIRLPNSGLDASSYFDFRNFHKHAFQLLATVWLMREKRKHRLLE